MTRARRTALLLAAALAGCASARTVSDADRHSLSSAFDGKLVYLRASLFVLPFFGEESARLASAVHPDSIDLVRDAGAQPVPPGPVEAMLPLGTRVRLRRLEFPTGPVMARRPAGTPRESPWVYLTYAGAPQGRELIAVLRPSMTTREEVLAALGDLFSDDEPALWLKNLGPETKKAIEEKRLLPGMDAEQVLLAWGRPERVRQDFEVARKAADGPERPTGYVRTETWSWPLGVRTATFKEGRLTAATPPLQSSGP